MSETDEPRETDESTDEPDVEAHLVDEFSLKDETADKGLIDEAGERQVQDDNL